MWVYEKKLLYPVEVGTCNPKLAKYLTEQYGGADGELAAALRYMNQRYTVPSKVIGVLTDIATEEFSHLEMLATMIYKLTKDATPEQFVEAGLGAHFVNHGNDLFYENAGGVSVLPQRISKRKAIRLPICMKTSLLKKRRERHTNRLIDVSDDPFPTTLFLAIFAEKGKYSFFTF